MITPARQVVLYFFLGNPWPQVLNNANEEPPRSRLGCVAVYRSLERSQCSVVLLGEPCANGTKLQPNGPHPLFPQVVGDAQLDRPSRFILSSTRSTVFPFCTEMTWRLNAARCSAEHGRQGLTSQPGGVFLAWCGDGQKEQSYESIIVIIN